MGQSLPIRGGTGDDERGSTGVEGSSASSALGKALVALAIVGLAYLVSRRVRSDESADDEYEVSIRGSGGGSTADAGLGAESGAGSGAERASESAELTSAVSRIEGEASDGQPASRESDVEGTAAAEETTDADELTVDDNDAGLEDADAGEVDDGSETGADREGTS